MYKYLIPLLLIFAVPLFAQDKEKGKLAIFEDEANGNTDSSEDDEADIDIIISGIDECGTCGDGFFNGLINIARIMVYSEEFDEHFIHNRYTPYPYYFSDAGIYGKDTEKNFAIALATSYYHHTDHLNGFLLSADLSPHPMFSINIDYSDLTETLRTRYDHLRLYNLFINYNRLRSERFIFSWGIGVKGIRGDTDLTAVALSTDIELFPVAPVSFSLHYNIGYYPSATVDDFSINLNLHYDRYRFKIGFQNFRAGRMNIGGLTLGLGLYL